MTPEQILQIIDSINTAAGAVCGCILGLIVAVTWKG